MGVQNGCWHPLLSSSVPHDVLVLTGESMWEGNDVDQFRRVLRELGRRRVVELREYGADYLLDVEIVAPRYTGPEGLWIDEHHDWIAYASHEGTVAFGGVLSAGLVATWLRPTAGDGPDGRNSAMADPCHPSQSRETHSCRRERTQPYRLRGAGADALRARRRGRPARVPVQQVAVGI